MVKSSSSDDLPCQLLVEGADDVAVVRDLCLRSNILKSALDSKAFRIIEKGGVEKLIPAIPVTLKKETLKILGIIVDADENFQGRLDSIRKAFTKAGYPEIPTQIPSDGWIYQPTDADRKRVGIWIMPNNQDAGILEDFLLHQIDNDDALLIRAREILDELA
jgi:hypothetical protein